MTIEELEEIVHKASILKIKKALRANGFRNCKLNLEMRKINLVDIVRAKTERRTDYHKDGRGNEFIGYLYCGVKGWEQREFVLVEFLAPYKRGSADLSTKKMLIYARETRE